MSHLPLVLRRNPAMSCVGVEQNPETGARRTSDQVLEEKSGWSLPLWWRIGLMGQPEPEQNPADFSNGFTTRLLFWCRRNGRRSCAPSLAVTALAVAVVAAGFFAWVAFRSFFS